MTNRSLSVTDIDYDGNHSNEIDCDANTSKFYFDPYRSTDDGHFNYDNNCEYYSNETFNQKFKSDNIFSILNLNIRSLPKKIDRLKEYLSITEHNFSIIAIQETWFKSGTTLDYYNLTDYNLETTDRVDNKVGGVGLYVSNNFEYKLRSDLCTQNEIFESCFIEINRSHNNSKNIIVGTLYRHHHHSINEFNNQLEDIINKINLENKLIYLTGDFNIDILKDKESNINDFIDLMFSFSLYPPLFLDQLV